MSSWRLILVLIFSSSCLQRPVAETSPTTSNLYVAEVRQSAVDKIDLLFMVDNSTSMADKQDILQAAVPVLVQRLTSPNCIDSKSGTPTGDSVAQGRCARGEPEFEAVKDIHVAIVTSSLGAHGGDVCPDAPGTTPNDAGHLLATVRPNGSNPDAKLTFDASRTWNGSGFLNWDIGQRSRPPGTQDANQFESTFQDMIAASGEHGCGYEASLESWYRFLVDPEPPANVSTAFDPKQTVRGSALVVNADGSTTCRGCDAELLAQRNAFLRPDSLLAIVMLSDENDCSIRDDGAGWFVASQFEPRVSATQPPIPRRMPRASSACAEDANDPCCRSCASRESVPPKGCSALAEDEVCKTAAPGHYATWDASGDSVNLRCFEQKRRFGFDLLYPISRYVDALSKTTLTLQSDGKTQVPNPLFAAASGREPRSPSLVFLAGIVGVPWQDIADDASLAGPGLKYLNASELVAKGRWRTLVGDPGARPPLAPSDPFMAESTTPRSGTNPITRDAIVPANSPSPSASPINGHEHNVSTVPDDLQYACTFALASPRECKPGDEACDCAPSAKGDGAAVAATNSPLCQPAAGGMPTSEQRLAKAYPGTRELLVLQGLNEQGIVASICPKVTQSADPARDPDYGYNPAVAAIIDRLKVDLTGKCLPRPLQTDPVTGQASCKVIEARPPGTACDCSSPGRADASRQIIPAVDRELESGGHCDGAGQPACSTWCKCEILQESKPDASAACRAGQPPPVGSPPGYCYVEDSASPLLEGCPPNQKRTLQFVSTDEQRTPVNGAVAIIACLGATVTESTDAQDN